MKNKINLKIYLIFTFLIFFMTACMDPVIDKDENYSDFEAFDASSRVALVLGQMPKSSVSTVNHVAMLGLRPDVDDVQVVGNGSLVEFNANKLRELFALPT